MADDRDRAPRRRTRARSSDPASLEVPVSMRLSFADGQQGGNEREPSLDRGHAPVPNLLLEKLGLVPHDPSLTDRVFDPCPPLVSEFARFLPAIDLVVDGGDAAVPGSNSMSRFSGAHPNPTPRSTSSPRWSRAATPRSRRPTRRPMQVAAQRHRYRRRPRPRASGGRSPRPPHSRFRLYSRGRGGPVTLTLSLFLAKAGGVLSGKRLTRTRGREPRRMAQERGRSLFAARRRRGRPAAGRTPCRGAGGGPCRPSPAGRSPHAARADPPFLRTRSRPSSSWKYWCRKRGVLRRMRRPSSTRI